MITANKENPLFDCPFNLFLPFIKLLLYINLLNSLWLHPESQPDHPQGIL